MKGKDLKVTYAYRSDHNDYIVHIGMVNLNINYKLFHFSAHENKYIAEYSWFTCIGKGLIPLTMKEGDRALVIGLHPDNSACPGIEIIAKENWLSATQLPWPMEVEYDRVDIDAMKVAKMSIQR